VHQDSKEQVVSSIAREAGNLGTYDVRGRATEAELFLAHHRTEIGSLRRALWIMTIGAMTRIFTAGIGAREIEGPRTRPWSMDGGKVLEHSFSCEFSQPADVRCMYCK
jgi:hypothetical protein